MTQEDIIIMTILGFVLNTGSHFQSFNDIVQIPLFIL